MKPHREKLFWTATVRDPTGKIVKVKRFPFHSFLTQYYLAIYFQFQNTYNGGAQSSVAITDTAGSSVNLFTNAAVSEFMAGNAGAGGQAYGILVGTGSAANTGSTHGLSTQILNGNGAGQLSHGSSGITLPAGTTPLSFTLTRTFTNNSGGSITINEVGYAVSSQNSTPAQDYFMIIRDVLGTGVTVLNGNNVTWTLTMSYTIS